jgi:hypothetical protein
MSEWYAKAKRMTAKTTQIAKLLPLTIPFLMIASLILLIDSSFFSAQPELLSRAITIDLLVIVPMVYFLIIRKRDVPKITVVSIFVLGIVVLSYFLPEENQQWLEAVKTYVLPIIELGIVSLIVYKVMQLSKAYRKEDKTSQDFYTILKEAATQVFPKKIATVLVTEISVIYYGFIRWRAKKISKNEFTYHKKNALISITAGFTLIIVAETFGLHSWLVKWNTTAGWIISCLSAYTALQFFALTKSILMRPIAIDVNAKVVHLKYGYFTELSIPAEQIKSVELFHKDLPDDKSVIPFSPLGSVGEHNIVLHFTEELSFSGMYGIRRKAKSIAIFIDEKEQFKAMVEKMKDNL